MADESRGFKVKVDPNLPESDKLLRFAEILKGYFDDNPKLLDIEEIVALGLVVRLWLSTMEHAMDGTLMWDASHLSRLIGWRGDPQFLVNALSSCGATKWDATRKGFINATEQGFIVHEWAKWQSDPMGQREKWREQNHRRGKREPVVAPAVPLKKEMTATDEAVRQLLQQMRISNIPGQEAWKREQLEAWLAQGIKGAAIQELIMNNPGQDLATLKQRMKGSNGHQAISGSQLAQEVKRRMEASEKLIREGKEKYEGGGK